LNENICHHAKVGRGKMNFFEGGKGKMLMSAYI